MEELWLVGKHVLQTDLGAVWEFQGIFETRNRAIEVCRNENYFIAPVSIGYVWPDELVEWIGAYYPFGEADEVKVGPQDEVSGD
jgi:hypothetical protein